MQQTFKRLALAIAGAGLLTLYGCGGGDGAGVAGPAAIVIPGVVAAGLPMVGSVTVKDVNGVTRSTPIGDNGAYAIDVTGLSAPFVFRASGTVGGRQVVIHSAASAADVGGTINITPLTDLVVANIAGELAANYFDGGNFSGVTKAELDAEVAGLKAKLLPVLQAMGVDASIDLLRTAFTPLSSALDKALDVIRVSMDSGTNSATITNLVTQQQIVDSLAAKAASETAATPLPGAGMATTANDIPLIRKAVTDFSDKFANGLPSPGVLLPLMHDRTDAPFRHSDLNAADFADRLATFPALSHMRFTDIVISRIDYTTVSALGGGASVYPRAFVSFNISNSSGVVMDQVKTMQIAKGDDGVWRLRGDNRRLDIFAAAHTVKAGNGSGAGCIRTGLEFGIEDPNSGNNGTGIQYVMVEGPGLPQGGLKYAAPSSGGAWTIQNVPSQSGTGFYVLATNCPGDTSAGLTEAQIAAIPNDAKYTITPFDGNGVRSQLGGNDLAYEDRIFAYTESVPGRPLTVGEAGAAAFPVVATSPLLSNYVGGGDLTISAPGKLPASGWASLGVTNAGGQVRSVESDLSASATGNASVTLSLSQDGAVTRRDVRVASRDLFWRVLMTVLN